MYLLHVSLTQGQITQRVRCFTFTLRSANAREEAEAYWQQCASATFYVETVPEYLPQGRTSQCHVANKPQ